MLIPDFGFETPSVGSGNFQYDPSGRPGLGPEAPAFPARLRIYWRQSQCAEGAQVALLQGAAGFQPVDLGWAAGPTVLGALLRSDRKQPGFSDLD